tara:strand:- start:434 stop:1267 length:834 start_codon:yes stop_codon:yes gene_type:complete
VLGKKNMQARDAACATLKIVLRGSMVSEMANSSSGDTGGGICPICKSNDVPRFRAKDDYQFRKCRQCAFVFLHPMPKESVLESMYNTGGRITADNYPKAKSRFHRGLRTAIQLYRFAWRGPVLDIGCGGGFQVEAFRLLGMRPCGLDIGANSIAYARNNFGKSKFYRESFQEFSNRKLKFNLIYSSEVIEHIVKLDEYMKLLYNSLNNKGYVYITTPNIESDLVPENINDWDVFNPPRHVQFFNPDNLKQLFADYGFTAKRRLYGPKAGLRYIFRKR